MAETKYKVGDRVACYSSALGRVTGKVVNVALYTKLGQVLVKLDTGSTFWFHLKQCRPLRKKRRRTWWVSPTALALNSRLIDHTDCIEVAEVRRKKGGPK